MEKTKNMHVNPVRINYGLLFLAFMFISNSFAQETTAYTTKVDNNIPEPTRIDIDP